jgi:hypothetical protein
MNEEECPVVKIFNETHEPNENEKKEVSESSDKVNLMYYSYGMCYGRCFEDL